MILFLSLLLVSAVQGAVAPTTSGPSHEVQHVADDPVTLDLGRVSRADALRAIADAADLRLVFDPSLDGLAEPVTVRFEATPALDAVRAVLAGSALELFVTTAGVPTVRLARTGTVTGRVTDAETGEALQGATVFLVELERGDATDPEGRFELTSVPAGLYTLRISSIGFVAQERSVEVQSDRTARLDVALEPDIVGLGAVTVRGRPVTGYGTLTATTATKLGTSTLETPLTVNVLAGELLEDRLINRPPDAVRFISNIQVNGGYDEAYFVRGFLADQNLRNGMVYQPGLAEPITQADVENLDRVEVLKGPSSVLYGQMEPGGVINYVTKRPLDEFHASVQIDVGTLSLYRGVGDITGPLTRDGSVGYRLSAAYQSNGADRDFVEQERFMVAPALSWQISERTALDVNAEYLYRDVTTDFGFPINYGDPNGEVYLQLPRDRFLGEPDDRTETDQFVVQSFLAHDLTSDWTIEGRLQFTDYGQLNTGTNFIFPDFGVPETEVFRAFAAPYERFANTYQGQLNVTGRFATGPLDHTLFVGVEARRGTVEIRSLEGVAANLDIFDPVYGQSIQFPAEPSAFGNLDDESQTLAVGVQSLTELGEAWNLLLGGRLEDIAQDRVYVAGSREGEALDQDETAFTPQVGLVFQPWSDLSFYANYAQSFRPTLAGTQADGSLLPPVTGEQVEVGAKVGLFQNRAVGSIALFNIDRENVPVADLDAPPFSGILIPTGRQRSRGVELELRGEVTDRLELTSYYAFTDAEVVEDTEIPVGDRLPFASRHSAALWAQYRPALGVLEGLILGSGFTYFGDTEVSLPNIVTIDDYVLVDASVVYERDRWRAGVHLKNLLDELYFAGGVPQNGFTATTSVALSF